MAQILSPLLLLWKWGRGGASGAHSIGQETVGYNNKWESIFQKCKFLCLFNVLLLWFNNEKTAIKPPQHYSSSKLGFELLFLYVKTYQKPQQRKCLFWFSFLSFFMYFSKVWLVYYTTFQICYINWWKHDFYLKVR